MSKLSPEILVSAINDIIKNANENKRKFTETVELQIGLKNYDLTREKKIAGTIVCPNVTKPKITYIVVGDQKHLDECKEKNIECIDSDGLTKFKKNKKVVKKWAKKYDVILASDSLIRQIPRLVGPQLNKMGKFPTPVSHDTPIENKIAEIQRTVKLQMKKVLCLCVAVGHIGLTPDQLSANITLVINTLISLLKKGWQNIKSLTIKSTMGPPQKIY